MNSLFYKEIETSKFLIGELEDIVTCDSKFSASNSSNFSSSFSSSSSEPKQALNQSLLNDFTSENYFMKNHNCFNNLIQFDQQSYDPNEKKVDFLFFPKFQIFLFIFKFN